MPVINIKGYGKSALRINGATIHCVTGLSFQLDEKSPDEITVTLLPGMIEVEGAQDVTCLGVDGQPIARIHK